jgi:hypothetical protein
MAYPTVDGPYGLVPIGLVGERYNTGGFTQKGIATTYGTSIFQGDIVKGVGGGTVEKDTGTTAATPNGIFIGCSFTDASMGPRFQNYWPASQVATDAKAFIVDDPNILFKIAITSSGVVISSLAITDIGANLQITQTAGDTINGVSRVSADDTSATTNTFPLRVISLVEETRNAAGGYTEAICKWNAGHQYGVVTGV